MYRFNIGVTALFLFKVYKKSDDNFVYVPPSKEKAALKNEPKDDLSLDPIPNDNPVNKQSCNLKCSVFYLSKFNFASMLVSSQIFSHKLRHHRLRRRELFLKRPSLYLSSAKLASRKQLPSFQVCFITTFPLQSQLFDFIEHAIDVFRAIQVRLFGG